MIARKLSEHLGRWHVGPGCSRLNELLNGGVASASIYSVYLFGHTMGGRLCYFLFQYWLKTRQQG